VASQSPVAATPKITSHRDLVAWQRATALAGAFYKRAALLPEYERYAMASQIRRASVSVPSNIAEGFGTGTRPGFLKHLRISRGSLAELDSLTVLASDLHQLPIPETLTELYTETGRVLQGMITSLERSEVPGPTLPSRRPSSH